MSVKVSVNNLSINKDTFRSMPLISFVLKGGSVLPPFPTHPIPPTPQKILWILLPPQAVIVPFLYYQHLITFWEGVEGLGRKGEGIKNYKLAVTE